MSKIRKIIELPCEEESKKDIANLSIDYLSTNKDFIEGRIAVFSDRPEAVDIVFYEGSENVPAFEYEEMLEANGKTFKEKWG